MIDQIDETQSKKMSKKMSNWVVLRHGMGYTRKIYQKFVMVFKSLYSKK